jgi:hypothetical protein
VNGLHIEVRIAADEEERLGSEDCLGQVQDGLSMVAQALDLGTVHRSEVPCDGCRIVIFETREDS